MSWSSYYSMSPTSWDIYIQNLDSSGSRKWIDTGVAVCTATGTQEYVCMIPDGSGGSLLFWDDPRYDGAPDIFGQRVDALGDCRWTADGVVISSASGYQTYCDAVADGNGGAWVVWETTESTDSDIMFSKIDSTGGKYMGQATNGNVLCQTTGDQTTPKAVSDGSGGVIVTWSDDRHSSVYSLYASRILSSINTVWTDYGVRLTTRNIGFPFSLVSDGEGGAIITWKGSNYEIEAQRIDRGGAVRWGQEGIVVGEDISGVNYLVTAACGDGSSVTAYVDNNFGYDIYAQRIDRHGAWGNASPMLHSSADVPNDQGGYTLLTWQRSYLDEYYYSAISHYSIWRRLDEAEAAPFISGSSDAISLSDIGPDFDSKAVRVVEGLDGASAWEWIENVDALMREEYSYAAPTYYDSIAGDPGTHLFQVAAHKSDPLVFWLSEPVQGYSVDDLAPTAPASVSGAQVESPAGIRIDWQVNVEPDLSHYNIYRNDGSDFQPGPGSLLATTTVEYATDGTWLPEANAYYRVAAVDVHGNIGPSSLLRPEDVVLGTELHAFAATFAGDGVLVSWSLAEAGETMAFNILRAEGASSHFEPREEIAISVDEMDYRFTDASTLPGRSYRYRVDVTDEDGTRTLFETGSIGVPAREIALYQNHPNPFNPTTEVKYYLPVSSMVRLEVYDVSGRRVTTLVDAVQTPGPKSERWNGTSAGGDRVSSGVYFCRLTAGKKTLTMKMILLR